MEKAIKMVSLILGGGQGSRLSPLTKDRSKPAVPIAGKYRLIDIPISNCIHSGVRRIFVLTQFNSASLNQHIKNTYNFDHFSRGFVDILAAEQTPDNPNWFQGTADAVRQSLRHMNTHQHDYILILSGDQLYQMDFLAMVKEHIAKGAELSIATIPVVAKEATEFGIMKVDKKGMIDSFIEKPKAELLPDWVSPVPKAEQKAGKNYLASMGIYIFNKETMQRLLDEHPNATDFGKEIIPAAIKSGSKVASYLYNGYWTDIGNIGSFFEANLELTDPLPKFNLFDSGKMIFTRARQLPPSKYFGTTLKRSVVTEGSICLAKSLERCVIGIRSRIGEKTTMKNVIMMGADYYEHISDLVQKDRVHIGVGKNCHIEQAILDKNCRIGNNVIIKGDASLPKQDHEAYSIVDGIVVVKKNATIPDGTHIGV
ncbi:MAG: glucose-1-phosphate adenylyltransferase [Saprospiraceae bacterium]|nr:glucose-1-phosphate adenylyltransferase [Saprospiraceae bacterium]